MRLTSFDIAWHLKHSWDDNDINENSREWLGWSHIWDDSSSWYLDDPMPIPFCYRLLKPLWWSQLTFIALGWAQHVTMVPCVRCLMSFEGAHSHLRVPLCQTQRRVVAQGCQSEFFFPRKPGHQRHEFQWINVVMCYSVPYILKPPERLRSVSTKSKRFFFFHFFEDH